MRSCAAVLSRIWPAQGKVFLVFAVVSVLCGRFAFEDDVPVSTWVGLAIIVVGGLMIQFGAKFKW